MFELLPAVSITADNINSYKQQRQQEGAANATINRELATLKRAFNLGLKEDRIERKLKLDMLHEDNVRTNFVDDAGFDRLVAAAQEPWQRLLLETYFTYGWRKGELLGLRVRQLDFANRIIRLAPGTTKNKEPRQAPMTPRVEELLRFGWRVSKPTITCSLGRIKKDARSA